jgi:hypothetical protein
MQKDFKSAPSIGTARHDKLDLGELFVRVSLRARVILITVFFLAFLIGFQGSQSTISAQDPVQITDVVTPEQVSQATQGQVTATVYNSVNQTFEGFAQFTDNSSEITCTLVNFTIGYQETKNIIVNYRVAENATIGPHLTTFEINVGQVSFLYYQYELPVTPVAAISQAIPGHIFYQGQPGILIAEILNRADRTSNVRVELFGSSFINVTQDVELAPGNNTIAIALVHNASHVFDFGMGYVNITLFYKDVKISSALALIPVDLSPINKLLAIIVPVAVFEILVLYYAYRKLRRTRQITSS